MYNEIKFNEVQRSNRLLVANSVGTVVAYSSSGIGSRRLLKDRTQEGLGRGFDWSGICQRSDGSDRVSNGSEQRSRMSIWSHHRSHIRRTDGFGGGDGLLMSLVDNAIKLREFVQNVLISHGQTTVQLRIQRRTQNPIDVTQNLDYVRTKVFGVPTEGVGTADESKLGVLDETLYK